MVLITKINPYSLEFSFGYGFHLLVDFIDNSINSLGTFLPTIEWGLISGWGEIPRGGWDSEFWLQLGDTYDHDLWSIFIKNGWGIPIGIEFITYHDLVLMMISIPLFFMLIYLSFKKILSTRGLN